MFPALLERGPYPAQEISPTLASMTPCGDQARVRGRNLIGSSRDDFKRHPAVVVRVFGHLRSPDRVALAEPQPFRHSDEESDGAAGAARGNAAAPGDVTVGGRMSFHIRHSGCDGAIAKGTRFRRIAFPRSAREFAN